MIKFYEIVRLSNQDIFQDNFEEIRKLIRRCWTKKAMEFLQNWDYGHENLDEARVYNKIWDSPTDPDSPTDRVLRQKTYSYPDGERTQYLCESASPDGLYVAYYLTSSINIDTENF